MHIPSRSRWIIGLIFLSISGHLVQLTPIPSHPEPTGGILHSDDLHSERKAWIELMHRTAPGTSWKQIEYQNQYDRSLLRQRSGNGRSDCNLLYEVPGTDISGRWVERGSNNQAGSVFETAYDAVNDDIWLISAGGSLWKTARTSPEWQLINQDIQLDPDFLKIITLPDKRQRLLAFSGQLPHYSDNGGQSWQRAIGLITEGESPDFRSPVLLNEQSVFVLAKPDYYSTFEIYHSRDRGQSYRKIMDLDAYQPGYFSLCHPYGTDTLILARKTAENNLRLQEWNAGQQVFVDIEPDQPLAVGRTSVNLTGGLDSLGQLQLFTYVEKDKSYFLYRSTDKGKTWTELSKLPQAPWEVGIFLSPTRPNTLYMGEVEAFRSDNGGKDWQKINEWWEYYDDVPGALHADIMAFAEYQTPEAETFSLISHHGGISISYDQFATQENISLTDLNTSQYYCIRTDPIDPNFVYAGSQDQGFQRAQTFESGENGPQAFEQVISGDYGPIVFTREGTALWTVYPDGWINYYDDPRNGFVKASYELVSEDESVWFPPIVADPTPGRNGLLMAGGNIKGGEGSHLIQLEYKDKKISTRQFDYNFKLESAGGALSALATAPSDPNFWYASTTNGRFFYSEDQGKTWEQSLNFVPEGHYLYGQAIWVSKSDPKRVILAGSGYNNPPVYLSKDGGRSFNAINRGLPATLIFSLASTPDEGLLFAATESGPYVYDVDQNRWHDLSSVCSPAQTFWSVEYVPSIHTVRFGTYGRGIWDFQLDQSTPIPEPPLARHQVRMFPNPTSGPVTITTQDLSGLLTIQILDAQGKFIRQLEPVSANEQISLDISHLSDGMYFLVIGNGSQKTTRKLILSR
ncbi:T9SS type A sorting domain-containing protein [Flavilitoribacter nigricans]|uniref:Secretion system C-terminal sorting domain-containing protein n=1 Tax=Flavilitoribacter nigricans (strain ATCC 23147 / DSM 23189 / NBRC 102662 / NCIMB 1420 / SS-2) TaxID=1122177 RepID=A0A2D0NBR9_FLAN2|nr:T9SS type A sorting domain-containing protein [Flavilitoribacter nigricans]PHN05810.1 hypothetical protein CRP01_15165 [Flavilitoribacter nigricans DSM 23189 = NBRC 102662]